MVCHAPEWQERNRPGQFIRGQNPVDPVDPVSIPIALHRAAELFGIRQSVSRRILPLEIGELRDGWYYSGDVGYMDEQQRLFAVDRKKDIIITAGENVYSIEIENLLSTHATVVEVAVIVVRTAQDLPFCYICGKAFIAATISTETTCPPSECLTSALGNHSGSQPTSSPTSRMSKWIKQSDSSSLCATTRAIVGGASAAYVRRL